jgi:hypothetical protein
MLKVVRTMPSLAGSLAGSLLDIAPSALAPGRRFRTGIRRAIA